MELKESKKFNSNQIISGNKSVNKLSSKGPGIIVMIASEMSNVSKSLVLA
jgi:hypothetical protein